ncbi:MAG TPA: ABC transporter permease [Gaiellaceae bacterium]|jgi:peptide/nickel transport system permease protein
MLRYVVRRLFLLVPILIGVSLLIFFWIRALPGNPADALLGERSNAQLVQQYKQRYGLDRPIPVQYWDYVKTTLGGDLGTSISTRRAVTAEIKQRFPATIELAVAAMLFAVALGIPLGFFAAKRHGGVFDNLTMIGSLLGISVPIFFLAIILKYIFAVRLHWLPSVGRIDVLSNAKHPTNFYILDALITRDWHTLWDVIRHLILPAIALGSIPLAIITRITRAAVLDVQNEDYVRTARAKGLPPLTVDRRHVLRNAMLPVSTIIGLQTGLLLSGAVLTETVFAFPGMGSWLRDAIFNSDYPVLQGGILFLAVVFVLVNLLVDISYAIINPRIRYS